ncbi:MAG: carcinine hydrolase/isopenicillin-N N-acyltransferase family protein, partial [Candidatus Hodarchaeales archaeon]
HYLSNTALNTDLEELASSFARYSSAQTLIQSKEQTIEGMKGILNDQSNLELPICRRYVPNKELENVGTVCTIIMDLPNLTMHITRGNPFDHEFERLNLSSL